MDIMLDLETLGTRCGSVILSIGACVMERDLGNMGQNFHEFLTTKDQVLLGATIDPDTVMWWLAQSDQARRAMVTGQDLDAKGCHDVLRHFGAWLNMVCPEVPARKVWSNGADFDIALLNDLYLRCGMKAPWIYNAARDMRTVLDLAGGFKPAYYKAAPTCAHDALQDAIYQADVVALALKRINKA